MYKLGQFYFFVLFDSLLVQLPETNDNNPILGAYYSHTVLAKVKFLFVSMVNTAFKWPFQGFTFSAQGLSSIGYFSVLKRDRSMKFAHKILYDMFLKTVSQIFDNYLSLLLITVFGLRND